LPVAGVFDESSLHRIQFHIPDGYPKMPFIERTRVEPVVP
jgi:hypothetical protein